MGHRRWMIFAAAGLAGAIAAGPAPAADAPFSLMQNSDESVYELPMPPREDEGYNTGGVNLDLRASVFTDYVFRGIDRSEANGIDPNGIGKASEDAPNLQYDGKLTFNLDKLPHPIIGVFANVFNDDPVSRFQEIRPYFGLELELRPMTIAVGQNTYIFPERDQFNTSEIWARVSLDDARVFATEKPIFSPYVYGAYDYDHYDGFYLEAGVSHDIVIEDTGLTLTALADIGYVISNAQFTRAGHKGDSGFQHYDLGLIASYSLNNLLNIPRRYGSLQLQGYLYYTDGLSDALRADTQTWGGVGIRFLY